MAVWRLPDTGFLAHISSVYLAGPQLSGRAFLSPLLTYFLIYLQYQYGLVDSVLFYGLRPIPSGIYFDAQIWPRCLLGHRSFNHPCFLEKMFLLHLAVSLP